MNIVKTKINHTDARGFIKDILTGVPVDAITLVTFTKGAVRGNHYHNQTVQHDYIVKGSMICRQQKEKGGSIDEAILVAGDVVTHPAGTRHAFKALEEAEMLSCTHGPRQGENFESDVVRLTGEEKLID
ncbi:MAG: hypothetical protein A2664_00765 [Candidatus Taylorbacteria bacterium RIFCSPHIGHO2_01_FULL_46_22b]|uniref:Cupin type-2 domain-containing protein n=1 Tax=Candidatus Taylorbacteria bacterium RIFCSPHIGHO2_01_FULL_46_22b TaxID=1802301 RepID=A0A1G2M3I1_9BACT|nr:MAG: hypothetical protein A2664_00765 [Candidatus Taylorbacteria bacterium RIFCSPHIGHO2_01_FULL_46_22b]